MKKKLMGILLAGAMLLSVTACTNEEKVTTDPPETKPVETPVEVEDNISNAVVTDPGETPVIEERQVVDGKKQSYLTGEWKDAAVVDRRPMAVMIPDNKPALPQYGISKASVIFEAPMEGYDCTRFMAIFEDYDELEHIGPVRSARLYFMEYSLPYDAIYCNWGIALVPGAKELINSDRIHNISQAVEGIENPAREAFDRDKERKELGYAQEFTGIMTIDGYNAAVDRMGYRKEHDDLFEQPFVFAQDGYISGYTDYPDAKVISPGGKTGGGEYGQGGYGQTTPYFVYNEEDHLYHRYQMGEPQIDEYNGEELTCRNVIFMTTVGDFYNENTGYLWFTVKGEDTMAGAAAYFFTEGKVIEGYWLKDETDDGAYHYYESSNNEEIVFNQGKTWVCLINGFFYDKITIE